MSDAKTLGLPEFERLSGVMDQYLPLIAPVGNAILDHLPPFEEGVSVLDVACGTGEPGLTLARRDASVHLLGIDGARTMVDIASAKATRENLAGAKFKVMNAERLELGDASFDAVISRFGLLMFGDTMESARELRRVLRPGGVFSLAVWDDMATNTLVRTVIDALRALVPAELITPFENSVGAKAGDLLREVGLTNTDSEKFEWTYAFTDDDALWEFVSGPGLFARHIAAVPEKKLLGVKTKVLKQLGAHKQPGGDYAIPHACRLWFGLR